MLDFDSVLVFVISLSAAKCILVGVATVEIGASRSAHRFVVLFFHVQRGGEQSDGSQGPDCTAELFATQTDRRGPC